MVEVDRQTVMMEKGMMVPEEEEVVSNYESAEEG